MKRIVVVLVVLLFLGGAFRASMSAKADTPPSEHPIAAFSINGSDPQKVYSEGCFALSGEFSILEIRLFTGNAATNGRYTDETGWITALALGKGYIQIPSWKGWNICFGDNAYELLVALDSGAGENPREVWNALAVPPLEVTLTGPLTVTLGITTTYEISTTNGQIPFDYRWSSLDCSGITCAVLWDSVGIQTISVAVEDFWGAWNTATFSTEVVAVPISEPESHQIFLPYVAKPPIVCREPAVTQFSFAGISQSVAGSGCFDLGGANSILMIETTLSFASNGRSGDTAWVNAVGAPGFYEFSWQGFLICFGESEEQALSLLISADPNSAQNTIWYPDPICVPE